MLFIKLSIQNKLDKDSLQQFKKKIHTYYKKHGRIFPWRRTTNPYRILVSEVMLQQTQVDRVVLKYNLFIKTFPTFQALAGASLREVLTLWQGLGYNRRAKMLKETAEIVVKQHNGKLPKTEKELIALPGIGQYTSGAIRAFAYNEPSVFIETNIRTVFIHHFFSRKRNIKDSDIFPLIEKTLDTKNPREWYSALMDYGTMLKAEKGNASRRSAHHAKQSSFEGSDRQIRGAIIKVLVKHNKLTELQFIKALQKNPKSTTEQLQKLEKEGFIKKQKEYYSFA